MNVFLSVCLLTYRRNDLLRALMKELCGKEMKGWEVVVVDTSGEGDAREVLEGYSIQPGLRVKGIYSEERLSISGGRNHALGEAVGEWILFIDDDQVITAAQIKGIITKVKGQKGHFLAARLAVESVLPDSRSGRIFEKKLRQSSYFGGYFPGSESTLKAYHLSTDGVVFKKPPASLCFKEELGYRGGEDNDFFARYLGDLDCPVWGDIVIRDLVMPDRICLGYIWKDSYRRGCSYAQLETEPLGRSRGKLLPKYTRDLVGSFCLLAVDIVMWRDWPKSLGLVARQCGKMAGLSGRHYELYRDGNTNIS